MGDPSFESASSDGTAASVDRAVDDRVADPTNEEGIGQSGRRPSMVDVATAAGVSYQTVSRVMNRQARVHPDTRRRVLAAIEALDYRPNSAARALVTGRTSTVAVFASNTSLYGFARALDGIEEAAGEVDFAVTISVFRSGDQDGHASAVGRVLSQSPAGIVAFTHDNAVVAALGSVTSDVPVVTMFGYQSSGQRHVSIDEVSGAETATEYLLDIGHRTVHHVAIPPHQEAGRLLGWSRALRARGAAIPLPLRATWGPEAGYEQGAILARDPSVTAVLAGNDEVAIGVIRALADAGRSVPDDVSVVGFDDIPIAAYGRPALTTVAQDFASLGRIAFGLIHSRVSRGSDRAEAVPLPRLIVRESTAPPPR